jgi:cytochrome c oxidase cbb3-type subunit IV
MYKDILRGIAGIEVFPVISLIVFVAFFTAVLVWTARLDRHRLARLSSLPLDGSDGDTSPAGSPSPAVEERR